MTIQDELLTAQLAEASYVSNLTPNLTGEPLAKLLRGDKQSPLTSRLAEAISNNFTVVVQRDSSDAFGSGFDATVWRGNEGTPYAGKLYVSMRGSEGGQDFLVDFDLAVNDVGRAQLADMVNWWLRETAPSGEAVRQVRVATNAVGSSQAFFEAAQTGVGTGRLAGTTQIEAVTGHSLGGYLATAFTRLFGGKWSIEDTATFNSAGFTRGSEMPFRELEALLGPGVSLGRFPSANEQSNYFASNGINVTTNSLWFNQIGHRIEVFNEEGTGISNHSMYKLTDALAVGALLERLDPSLTMAKLNVLLAQGASAPAGSLEGVLHGDLRAAARNDITREFHRAMDGRPFAAVARDVDRKRQGSRLRRHDRPQRAGGAGHVLPSRGCQWTGSRAEPASFGPDGIAGPSRDLRRGRGRDAHRL